MKKKIHEKHVEIYIEKHHFLIGPPQQLIMISRIL